MRRARRRPGRVGSTTPESALDDFYARFEPLEGEEIIEPSWF